MLPEKVFIKDVTLREGQDTPSVEFSDRDKEKIACALSEAGVSEIEVIAPARVFNDLPFARNLKATGFRTPISGLIYATSKNFSDEFEQSVSTLDQVNVLIPLSAKRAPTNWTEKLALVKNVLTHARERGCRIGIGFPHALTVSYDAISEIIQVAASGNAAHCIIYDTAGSGNPLALHELFKQLTAAHNIPLIFHGHNDLGMATANALAALLGGASGLEVTVNGIGDRAGNTSLEQIIIASAQHGFHSGLQMDHLFALSGLVADCSGVPVHPLAPITGEFAFQHKSASHLPRPELFEAVDPAILNRTRSIID